MKALYYSPFHHPFVCWVSCVLFIAALLVTRRDSRFLASRFFATFFWVFTLEIAADALITGGWSPVPGSSRVGTALSIAFVVLGDFRYFLLVEYVLAKRLTLGVALRAVAFSLLIPLATAPISSVDSRVLYLLYEASFACVALLMRFFVIPMRGRALEPDARAYLYLLTGFEMVQYVAWAIADMRIIRGHELGWLLRIVPDALYYAVFLAFAWFGLPKSLRRGELAS